MNWQNKDLYVIRDSNDEEWESYEVYDKDTNRVILQTEDFDKVEALFGHDIPKPIVVIVY